MMLAVSSIEAILMKGVRGLERERGGSAELGITTKWGISKDGGNTEQGIC